MAASLLVTVLPGSFELPAIHSSVTVDPGGTLGEEAADGAARTDFGGHGRSNVQISTVAVRLRTKFGVYIVDGTGAHLDRTGAGPVLPRTISSDASSCRRRVPLSPRMRVISIWTAVTPVAAAGMWTVVSRGVTISASAVSS